MLRKLVLVVCAISLTLASCGHQVTPDRVNTAGINPGFMEIKFSTQGQLDFTNNWYILAVNQSGQEPYPRYANQTPGNWQNLDFGIVVYSQNGNVTASVFPFVNAVSTSGGTTKVPGPMILAQPQDLQVLANCNQVGNQFCVIVNRALLVKPGSPSPSPTGSASPCPTTSPTTTPSPSSTPSTTPSPSATPSSSPCGSGTWAFNWWVAQPSGSTVAPPWQLISAPNIQGIQDASWPPFLVDTSASVDQTWYALGGWPAAPSPASQLAGGEVINVPGFAPL